MSWQVGIANLKGNAPSYEPPNTLIENFACTIL